MSYCRTDEDGALVMFITKQDEEERVAKEPPAPAPESQGPVDYVNKTIDWDCPCLAYALNGPCASQFKEAFTCFSFSEAEPKGADCIPQFTAMRDCQALNPDYYRVPDENGDEDEEGEPAEADKADTSKEAVASTSS